MRVFYLIFDLEYEIMKSMEMGLKEATKIGQEILGFLKEDGDNEGVLLFEALLGSGPISNVEFESILKYIALYQFHSRNDFAEFEDKHRFASYEMALKVLLISHDTESW